ncbi:MAG: RES family NAD+ phosphorylase [bacterium]
MKLYRISKNDYIRDLSGFGAQLFGGRWNVKGTAVIYTAECRSLATLEYLVHMPLSYEPFDLSMATLRMPDSVSIEELSAKYLPKDWKTYPPPVKLAQIGSKWAKRKNTLLLKVPSVIVEGEFNFIINPAHPEMAKVKVVEVLPYRFDERLLRNQ